MKSFFIAILSFVILNNNCKELSEVRTIFQKGVNKKQLDNMIVICQQSSCANIIPYHAAATMKKAEFVWSPLKKLANFKKGKKMLEEFIKKYPKNIEARYVRWLTQKMAPSFLNYNQNLNEDYQYIMEHIEESSIEPSYKKTMLIHIKKIKNE